MDNMQTEGSLSVKNPAVTCETQGPVTFLWAWIRALCLSDYGKYFHMQWRQCPSIQ